MIMELKERCRKIILYALSNNEYACPYQEAHKAILYGLSGEDLTLMACCRIPLPKMAEVIVNELQK